MLRDFNKELEGYTSELGKVADEKALLSDRLKREILAGRNKEKGLLEAKEEIDTVRSDSTYLDLMGQKIIWLDWTS